MTRGTERTPTARAIARTRGTGGARARRGIAAAALLALVAAAAWLAGCAPTGVAPPRLEEGPRRARYEEALAERVGHVAADAELSAWASGNRLPPLPGVQGRLALASPDAFRLRIGSMFGTALDLSARGDSLTAYAPSRRMALDTPAARDSLGFGDPGGIGYRVWVAAWRPPATAWPASAWEDSLLVLAWPEGPDSLRMRVGSNGLPRTVELLRAGVPRVRADYSTWTIIDGVPWPTGVTVQDAAGDYVLRCKVDRVHFLSASDRARLAIAIPANATPVTRAEIRRALDKLGGL